MVALTLLIDLRLTSIARMDAPDMTVNFWNNAAASGRSDGRSGKYCGIMLANKVVYLQTAHHDRVRLHRGIVRSKGLFF